MSFFPRFSTTFFSHFLITRELLSTRKCYPVYFVPQWCPYALSSRDFHFHKKIIFLHPLFGVDVDVDIFRNKHHFCKKKRKMPTIVLVISVTYNSLLSLFSSPNAWLAMSTLQHIHTTPEQWKWDGIHCKCFQVKYQHSMPEHYDNKFELFSSSHFEHKVGAFFCFLASFKRRQHAMG